MKRVFLAALASCAAAVLGAQEPTQPQTITLTLDQAIEIALNENPTIRIADMEIERQDYVRKETVGNPAPVAFGVGTVQLCHHQAEDVQERAFVRSRQYGDRRR